jgi:Flp pilus assembly protein CpaB
MKKLIVLVEALALATCIVAVAFIIPQTTEMMVAASQAANHPEQSAVRKIIVFAQAVGNVLTVNPQSAKPWPQQRPAPNGGL